MDPVWLNIYSVLIVYTLAIVSPGPNFIMVVNTALSDSRRAGLYTALGVATGSGLFALAGMLGLILVIQSLPDFTITVQLLGGSYLIWLGVTLVRPSRKKVASPTANLNVASNSLRALVAYQNGLLTNLTNPKAWAFYFSLFTLVMTPETPFWAKAFLNSSMLIISFSWYAAVVILTTNSRIQPMFLRVQPQIRLLLGIVMISIGGRLLMMIS